MMPERNFALWSRRANLRPSAGVLRWVGEFEAVVELGSGQFLIVIADCAMPATPSRTRN